MIGAPHRVYEPQLRVEAHAPGSVLVNVTLVDGATNRDVDTLLLCYTLTPGAWEHTVSNSDVQRRVRSLHGVAQGGSRQDQGDGSGGHSGAGISAGGATRQAGPRRVDPVSGAGKGVSIDHVPVSVLWLGVLKGYDGMKQTLMDKFLHVPRTDVEPAMVDFACTVRREGGIGA